MLKEVNKGERDLTIWMMKAIVVFCDAKTIIGGNKDFYYGIESLQLSRKTPASSGKDRNIVAQISVDTLNSESILFIVDIVNLFLWIYYIQISTVSIYIISCSLWCNHESATWGKRFQ